MTTAQALPPGSVAPWAETVPGVGPVTVDILSLITDEDRPIPFAPDLAVEVVSPSQDAAEMAAKAWRYLRGGTRLVWVVWPQHAQIDVWHPDTLDGPVATLSSGDVLNGEDLIPGFSYPIHDFFAGPLR